MCDVKTMVALDCGNSSFRVVLGQFKDGKFETTVMSQIPNSMVKIGDYFYWDLLHIFSEFKKTLKDIVSKYVKIDSIGICTWGVDFALFDEKGYMLSNPLSYRNVIGEEVLEKLSVEEKENLFEETGILCDKINSVYMLSGIKKLFPSIYENAETCLMVPDILNYFLTGEKVNEPSELSTTQIVDARTRKINKKVCDQFGISEKLFPKLGNHGEIIGYVRKDILEELEIKYEIPVICVPSHDTASAVAAIPAKEKEFGFISCGTWSLIGTELEEPIINHKVIESNLTNEVGAFGKITLLKNSAGMFIVNQLKKEYDTLCGRKVTWDEISSLAESNESEAMIDLNAVEFFNPLSMSNAIWEYLLRTGQVVGEKEWGILFKTFYKSLAKCYASTISDIENVTNKLFEKIYIVGGGSASRILLRLTAEYVGKPIVVCYGESTSMGNLAVQLKYFKPELELAELRQIISDSYKTEEFVV